MQQNSFLLSGRAKDAIRLVEYSLRYFSRSVLLKIDAEGRQALHVERQTLGGHQLVLRLTGHGEPKRITNERYIHGLTIQQVVAGETLENVRWNFLRDAGENDVFPKAGLQSRGDAINVSFFVHFKLEFLAGRNAVRTVGHLENVVVIILKKPGPQFVDRELKRITFLTHSNLSVAGILVFAGVIRQIVRWMGARLAVLWFILFRLVLLLFPFC